MEDEPLETPVDQPVFGAHLAQVPKDVRERIEAVQEKSGFVPNVFLALARRPDEFRALLRLS